MVDPDTLKKFRCAATDRALRVVYEVFLEHSRMDNNNFHFVLAMWLTFLMYKIKDSIRSDMDSSYKEDTEITWIITEAEKMVYYVINDITEDPEIILKLKCSFGYDLYRAAQHHTMLFANTLKEPSDSSGLWRDNTDK